MNYGLDSRRLHLFSILATLIVTLFWGSISKGGEISKLEQRSMYQEALRHLSQGRIKKFSELQEDLEGYLLEDYLTYHKFNLSLIHI